MCLKLRQSPPDRAAELVRLTAYKSNLKVDSIDLNQGTASIRLSGELHLNGDCDQARVKAQLQQTALQFETVDEVEIFINGTPIDRLARG